MSTTLSSDMLLRDWAVAYWKTRDASKGWRGQLVYAADHLGKFLGRLPTLQDLTVDNLNDWIANMLSTKLARRTVLSKRRVVLVMWRAASDLDLVPMLPERKIRKVKCPPLIPKAWTPAEMGRLLKSARELTGYRRRCQWGVLKWATFWEAFILVNYQTGLRLGDMLALRFDDIDENGSFTIIQSKTGFPVTCHLEAETMRLLAMIPRGDGRCFRIARPDVAWHFSRVVRAAGLVGTIKTLRRTAATLCECATPGSASALLGHRDPGLAVRHYLDPRQVQATKARPPRILIA